MAEVLNGTRDEVPFLNFYGNTGCHEADSNCIHIFHGFAHRLGVNYVGVQVDETRSPLKLGKDEFQRVLKRLGVFMTKWC